MDLPELIELLSYFWPADEMGVKPKSKSLQYTIIIWRRLMEHIQQWKAESYFFVQKEVQLSTNRLAALGHHVR